MIDRLEKILAEYDALQQELQDPAVFSDQAKMIKLGKKSASMEELVQAAREYKKCLQSIDDASAMQSDPEMAELAEQELAEAQRRKEIIEKKLELLLVPKDPMDDRDVVLEVRAGTGGEEAALFAAELLRMYLRYCEERGWKTEIMDITEAAAGGLKEAIVKVEGNGVYGDLKFEGGTHRVQRIPATENKGRVHTSAATVAVLPEAEQEDLVIRTEDLRIDTFRAGGAGGQHVNKTDSAVRITHMPTGAVVACQSERSQLQNKLRAMELLRTRLYAHMQEEKAKKEGSMRAAQVGSGDRSEKIRTYNVPQDRITDHRINQNFHNLPGVMEGELGEIVQALKAAEHAERMENSK